MKKKAEKSEKILNVLIQNVESFQKLLEIVEDDMTRQNILRSIILFSCSGIDAVVKQIILETLEYVIERDEGAQNQLRKFTARQLKSSMDKNPILLAELLISKNIRKALINMLKEDLSYESLQSSEQLYKVAGHFNISTSQLIESEKRETLKKAFKARNIIVHQMDVVLEQDDLQIIKHSAEEVDEFYSVIVEVSRRFIDLVNEILKRPVTPEYVPMFAFDNGTLIIQEP